MSRTRTVIALKNKSSNPVDHLALFAVAVVGSRLNQVKRVSAHIDFHLLASAEIDEFEVRVGVDGCFDDGFCIPPQGKEMALSKLVRNLSTAVRIAL